MKHHTPTKRIAVIASFSALCCMLAFVIGLETAGNVRTFDKTQAALTDSAGFRGDIDGDGSLTVQDAILILERADGLETAAAEDIRSGDVDGDFKLTIKDALRLLRSLSSR
jgi:hypothetical protein